MPRVGLICFGCTLTRVSLGLCVPSPWAEGLLDVRQWHDSRISADFKLDDRPFWPTLSPNRCADVSHPVRLMPCSCAQCDKTMRLTNCGPHRGRLPLTVLYLGGPKVSGCPL